MAAAFDGFSIREYAAKMRTVDVLKGYPFTVADIHDDEDTKKKKEAEAAALLPPMTVTKFKWWSHELHRLKRSNTNQEVLTLVNKESSDIPRNDIEFTAVERRLDKVVAADGDGDGDAESEETQKSSDDDLSSSVCPVCKDFAGATVNGVNAHIDGCLVSREERRRQMRKAKSKAPKKRSIAEIFAVAPQIQTHEEGGLCGIDKVNGDDNCKVLGESGSVLKATKKVKKRKKEKRVLLLEENNNDNKKFKKKKIKKMKNEGLIANKEHSCKLKLQSSVNFAKKLNKRCAVDVWDSITVRARTPNLKCLSAKKRKVAQISKSFPKHKKPVFAVHSILKNHDACGQNSTYCGMQSDSQSNPCGIQHSERHVRFSGTDHILSPRDNGVSSLENNSDSFASPSEKDEYADSNKEATPVEVDRRENDVSIGTDIGTESCSIIGRKELPLIPNHVNIPSFLRPHMTHQEKVKHLPDKSVPSSSFATEDNNLGMFEQGYPTSTLRPAYSGIPRPICSLEEPCLSTQGATVSRDFEPSGKIDCVVHPIHGVSAMSSKENTGAFPVSSSSSFSFNENAKGRFPFLSQSEIDKFGDRGLYSQSVCPPVNLMGGSYPFPEWKQRAVTNRERCADEDFVGLPLNSHGELIQLRKMNAIPGFSSGLPIQNFTHLTSMSSLPTQNFSCVRTGDCSTAYNKHFLERELPNDRLNFFPMQNYVKENPRSHIRDLFGATYLQNTQRADIHQLDFESRSSHSFRPLVSDRNLMNVSISGRRQFDQVQNQKIRGMISTENSGHTPLNVNQPTMRLMGKDVAIGKSSKEIQGFEDGKVWMDKEIIAEHRPSSTALDTLSLNRNFQQNWFPCTASGKLKEPAAQSFEIDREHAPQQNLMMKAPESRFPHPYRNWQSNSMFENGSLTADRCPSSNLIRFAQLPASPAMFNGPPNFREQFISGAESLQSLQFGSQLPVLSASLNTCGHGVLGPAELNYKQDPPHFAKSSIGLPILNPECREKNVESSWFESSSKGMPPWLLHATLQVPNAASQSFPNVNSRHHQHIGPTANFFSTHHPSEISYPCNFMTSHLQVRENAHTPATTGIPPLARAIQEVNPKPTSATNMDRNRIKIKDPYPFKKTKRLAVKAVDSTKAPDMVHLETQGKLSTAAGSSRRNVFDEMQSNLRALDHDSSWKKESDLGCSQHYFQKARFEPFGVESSKMDSVMRSTGPIKLSAGAKHIIKPTPNVDQDNSRSIHSTIPFVAVTNGFREPQPQKKATKIYRFTA